MNEIEFHKKRIELTPGIIAGYKQDKELAIINSKRNVTRSESFSDQLLEFISAVNKRIAICSEEFRESEVFLNARGINPYPISTGEQIKLEEELMNQFPKLKRTMRSSIYVWFKHIFKKNKKATQ